MKVSIITVALNNVEYIEGCVKSVVSQVYKNLEYIVIDGGSTDGTTEIIKKYDGNITKWISEPDKGLYDAMNKGISLATGDIIGILNSDDFYADEDIISTVVKEFNEKRVDSVFADLVFIKRNDPDRIVRYYQSSHFTPRKFLYGWMPAHTTFFAKSSVYQQYGLFNTNYRLASDYELLLRFLGKHRISYSYIPKVFIKMRTGGESTKSFKSNLIHNREIVRACAENGFKTNIFKVYSKYFLKGFELFRRPE
jgi:glycosyltransferase involved in cell wall biosynthesis